MKATEADVAPGENEFDTPGLNNDCPGVLLRPAQPPPGNLLEM